MFSQLFQLRGSLSKKVSGLCEFIGIVVILIIWTVVSEMGVVPKGILPSPIKILQSLPELHFEDALVRNLFYSFKLNLFGGMEAVALAIPLGFLIGLVPVLKAIFGRYIEAIRFLPLTATIGLFIVAFGLDTNMKVQFLAFAIFIYLVPQVKRRVEEVEDVYVQTAQTIGANAWQKIRIVFVPAVFARVYNDIVNLIALSWTYVIVAEMVNTSGGGIGSLTFICFRQGRIDKVYAILIVIILFGILQDFVMKLLGKILFPYYKEGC